METATLDEFLALNDQLAALVEAGVPVDLGLETNETPSVVLEQISETVKDRMHNGESLSDALEGDEQTVPAGYRYLVQVGLRSGTLDAGLIESSRLATAVDRSQQLLRGAFFYPILVCGFAYLGMVGFCWYFVPTLTQVYEGMRLTPGWGLLVLQAIQRTEALWIAIPPALVIGWLFWRFYTRNRRAVSVKTTGLLSRLFGASQAVFQHRCANFAELLAALLQNDVSFDESLRLAAGACGDEKLSEGARMLAIAAKQGTFPGNDSPAARKFPPFLRWALWHADETIGRTRALQMAATIYRTSAERRTERLQGIAPIFACVLIGGGAVLLYGLALFVPVIQLMEALAFDIS
jgi:type II secretory pathway component PulF